MKVKELLSDESKWTQGCYARDAFGVSIPFDADAAVCWCLAGAIHRVYGPEPIHLRILRRVNGSLSEWNDAPDRTFAEVKALVEELDI